MYIISRALFQEKIGLVLYLWLDHGRPLGPEGPDGLEDVDDPLVLHPLQHDRQADEHARPTNPRTKHKDIKEAVKKLYFFRTYPQTPSTCK